MVLIKLAVSENIPGQVFGHHTRDLFIVNFAYLSGRMGTSDWSRKGIMEIAS
jgi:hypothetical protein